MCDRNLFRFADFRGKEKAGDLVIFYNRSTQLFTRKMRAFILCMPAFVAAMEPFVPPVAVQSVTQASLPSQISIHYDVPTHGLSAELEALKAASFLSRGGKTDVYFQTPVASDLELEYEKILKGVEGQIDQSFSNMRDTMLSAKHGSFLARTPQEPSVKLFVDSSMKNQQVDFARLNADAIAYATAKVANLMEELK